MRTPRGSSINILTTLARSVPRSLPASLVAAIGAFVLLDVFRLGRSDPDALAMEPLLANVTANPEFAICVALSANAAQVSILIVSVIFASWFLKLWWGLLCQLAVRVGLLGWLELRRK